MSRSLSLLPEVDGPFERSRELLEDFASNLYLACYLTEAIEQHQKIEQEYWDAVANEDIELMSQKKQELSLFEGAFNLTTSLFHLDEELL
jgi:hypothetical protein